MVDLTSFHFVRFNPYSNGSSFFIRPMLSKSLIEFFRFNPYSNGSSFFIIDLYRFRLPVQRVSILILMDLPFLFGNSKIIISSIPPVSILILMDLPFLSVWTCLMCQ